MFFLMLCIALSTGGMLQENNKTHHMHPPLPFPNNSRHKLYVGITKRFKLVHQVDIACFMPLGIFHYADRGIKEKTYDILYITGLLIIQVYSRVLVLSS